MQKDAVPDVEDCFCGAKARVVDWSFIGMYRVMCDNNHVLTKECATVNRAVHRWNKRVNDLK
ncbi:hypothetical protein D3C87_2149650 [compost metagenome]